MTNTPDQTNSRRAVIFDYLRIIAGCLLIACSVDLFLVPNQIVAGGLTGLAILLDHGIGGGVGLLSLVLNVPVLWLGWRYIGGTQFILRSVVGVTALALFIDLLAPYLEPPTSDRLLIIFYGGILNGVGIALVFRGRGTTGGVDILAQLAHRWWGMDVGQAMLLTNMFVLALAGVFFGPEQAMVALLLAWVTTKSLDTVLHGLSASRTAIIISEHSDAIRDSIMTNLNRGVTVLEGRGGYSGERRDVLYVVVQRHEAQRLKARIEEIDPNAFVVVSSPQEVRGGYPMPWQS